MVYTEPTNSLPRVKVLIGPSAVSSCLQILQLRLSTVGGPAFLVTAAQLWNRLPDNVTSANSLLGFRQQLKHTVFQQSFQISHTLLYDIS